jgi:hypothetical protein
MPARYVIGQIVYATTEDGTVYQGTIENCTWENGGYTYAVRTPIWDTKKWWRTRDLRHPHETAARPESHTLW